jgi:disulfide bond formation protein DsbB
MPNNRTLLLALAAACFGLIGVALYLQHVKDMLPCPYCVIQRYMFIAVGITALVGAWRNKIRVAAYVALAFAIGGLAAVGKHLYILAHPGFSCGIDPVETMLNKVPTATLMPWLFQADGLCENATDLVLGLSVPQWSAVWFVIVTVTLVTVLLRRRA